tara:strand:- start:332 stop:670 length:339 start_codon:yes stop_codon:yes gene_type:complete
MAVTQLADQSMERTAVVQPGDVLLVPMVDLLPVVEPLVRTEAQLQEDVSSARMVAVLLVVVLSDPMVEKPRAVLFAGPMEAERLVEWFEDQMEAMLPDLCMSLLQPAIIMVP